MTPIFPSLNAVLNSASFVLLSLGFYFIKTGRRQAHRACMIGAFTVSSAFLASYLWYHFHYTSPHFGGTGLARPLYFGMLISHIFLAAVMLPFILRMFVLAGRENFVSHKRLGRFVWPVWTYVSLTGVLIYMLLYHWSAAPL